MSEGEALLDTDEPIHGSAPLQMVQLLEQDKQNPSPITKEGRSELRIAMIEAAWVVVEHHPHWKGESERLSARIGTHKAIARKRYGGRLARAQSTMC